MKNISYKSIILSNLLDQFISVIFTILYSIYAYLAYSDSNLSLIEQLNNMNESLYSTSSIIMLNIFSVFAVTAIGYYAAHIAKKRYMLHGALSTTLSVILTIIMLLSNMKMSYAYWLTLLMWVFLGPAFGALGGYLYGKNSNK